MTQEEETDIDQVGDGALMGIEIAQTMIALTKEGNWDGEYKVWGGIALGLLQSHTAPYLVLPIPIAFLRE